MEDKPEPRLSDICKNMIPSEFYFFLLLRAITNKFQKFHIILRAFQLHSAFLLQRVLQEFYSPFLRNDAPSIMHHKAIIFRTKCAVVARCPLITLRISGPWLQTSRPPASRHPGHPPLRFRHISALLSLHRLITPPQPSPSTSKNTPQSPPLVYPLPQGPGAPMMMTALPHPGPFSKPRMTPLNWVGGGEATLGFRGRRGGGGYR